MHFKMTIAFMNRNTILLLKLLRAEYKTHFCSGRSNVISFEYDFFAIVQYKQNKIMVIQSRSYIVGLFRHGRETSQTFGLQNDLNLNS